MHTKLTQPLAPISGPPLHVHHGHNPNTLWLIDEQDGVWKHGGEMTACGRIEYPKALRLRPNVMNQSFDLVAEPSANSGLIWK